MTVTFTEYWDVMASHSSDERLSVTCKLNDKKNDNLNI
jgi:hypothetical protein